MAQLNKVMLIGRLTRDVEVKTFANGGKVAKFGLAVVGNRKKNNQTGQWEEDPCFLDVQAFNKGEHGRLADLCAEYLSKGRQVFIEGHLRQDSWTAQDGSKRHRILVTVDSVQFIDKKADHGQDGSEYTRQTQEGFNGPGEARSRYDRDTAEVKPVFAPDSVHDEIPF